MKKLLPLTLALLLLGVVGASADKKGDKKSEACPDAKKFHKEMVTKYDTNKDGKIDKEERAKFSDEDKKKGKAFKKAGEKKEDKKKV